MIWTFLRYNLVQVAAYVFDFGIFWTLANVASANPLIANVVGKAVAGFIAFILHKGFTFRSAGSGRTSSEALRYVLLLLLNIPLSSGALALLISFLPSSTAKVASDVIYLGITFALVRITVFRDNSPPPIKS
jgi:putative flippase GtrA